MAQTQWMILLDFNSFVKKPVHFPAIVSRSPETVRF